MSAADWWCMCGERMRYVVGGEWECPRCDHHKKVTPKPKTQTYRPANN
jgi:hypothetical protein